MGREAGSADPRPVARLRKATPADAAVLPELEQSAGLSFRADRELAWLADAGNLSPERYREIIADGWSWIAEDERGRPVAFAAKIPAMTLTTFRDVPWNAPFYRSMGFALIGPGELDPRLAGLLAKEASMGMPAERRCAMRRTLPT